MRRGDRKRTDRKRTDRQCTVLGERVKSETAFFTFNALLQFVAFSTSHFEVKHQVFDIKSQLRKCFLHQSQNSAAPQHRLRDSVIGQLKFFRLLAVDGFKQPAQFHKLRW